MRGHEQMSGGVPVEKWWEMELAHVFLSYGRVLLLSVLGRAVST